MKKTVIHILVNSLFGACAIGGLVYGVDGLRNILLFSVWGLLLATAFLHVAIDVAKRSDAMKAELLSIEMAKIPPVIDTIFDMAMLSILAFYGHFIVATAYVVHIILLSAAKGEIKKLKESHTATIKAAGGV